MKEATEDDVEEDGGILFEDLDIDDEVEQELPDEMTFGSEDKVPPCESDMEDFWDTMGALDFILTKRACRQTF